MCLWGHRPRHRGRGLPRDDRKAARWYRKAAEDGALTVGSAMEPLGVLTISTHGRGELVTGSVRVVSEGPVGGMLRFAHPAFGVGGVGAGSPASDAIFPVRRREGGIDTGVAIPTPLLDPARPAPAPGLCFGRGHAVPAGPVAGCPIAGKLSGRQRECMRAGRPRSRVGRLLPSLLLLEEA
ncbi:MAG: hypothetical protein OXG96_11955 [Acidobacteria bacterium]|nr:hypothetical protein [Acidobacteriota bacterium]